MTRASWPWSAVSCSPSGNPFGTGMGIESAVFPTRFMVRMRGIATAGSSGPQGAVPVGAGSAVWEGCRLSLPRHTRLRRPLRQYLDPRVNGGLHLPDAIEARRQRTLARLAGRVHPLTECLETRRRRRPGDGNSESAEEESPAIHSGQPEQSRGVVFRHLCELVLGKALVAERYQERGEAVGRQRISFLAEVR